MKRIAPSRGVVSVNAEGMSTDLKATIAELTATFETFKAENDERIKEVSKGYADVVKAEKVDRINATIDALADRIQALQKEQEARLDAIEAMATNLNAGGERPDPATLKADASIFLAGKEGVSQHNAVDANLQKYGDYAAGFGKFIKAGDKSPDVYAVMQVGSDPDGGYWVPTQMVNNIKSKIFETSPIRQIASVMTITTDSVKFPTDTNDATSGGWVGETASRTETASQQIGEQELFVREQYAMPKVTQKLLDMASINVEAWLAGKIADKMARTENTAFVNGTGVSQPVGFLNYSGAAVTTADSSRAWGVLQYVVTGASAGFPDASGIAGAADASALIDIIAEMNPAYLAGSRWVMARRSLAAIRKLIDGNGRYLVDFGQATGNDLQNPALGFSIHGYPVTTAEDVAAIGANSFSVAFGNFSVGYQIVDGRGIRVLRDNLTAKPYVLFYTTKWTGGDVVNFDAIKLLKFGTS